MLTRHPANPVLAAGDVPYPATLIFNAGVTKYRGRYVMVFRNDYGDFRGGPQPGHGTNLGIATSDDGVKWTVRPEPFFRLKDDEIKRAYDPRLTVVDGVLYMCVAVDTHHGIRGGLAVIHDLERVEILSLSVPDNRNMVLFPERVAGKLCRLERPFPIYGRGRPEAFDIWFGDSPDGRYWGNHHLVLGAERVPWCNNKIGPGAPPIRTERGWLALTHVVDKQEGRVLKGWEKAPWTKRYTLGAILLELDEPWKVIGMARRPVLEPVADYEADGFRGGVIFPGGLIDEGDGTCKVYYGGADTVECLATGRIADLVSACEPLA